MENQKLLFTGKHSTIPGTCLILVALLLVFTACEKYDDDQYGDICYVKTLGIIPGSNPSDPPSQTTTFLYDQHDMIITVMVQSSTAPNSRIDFTYNNNNAFLDFDYGGSFLGSAEATLDANGNVLTASYSDSLGDPLGDITFEYNSQGQITSAEVYDINTNTTSSGQFQWTNGNITNFISTEGSIKCDYFTGKKSALKLGKGNVALLAQPVIDNFAVFLSTDYIKTIDLNEVRGQATHVTYDFDGDNKARQVYWSGTSNNVFGTTEVEYTCY